MQEKRVHAIISGRVQGVWFRAWTSQEAEKRGLDGWVRNLADGSVEAVFSGPAEDVEDMLSLCNDGPPLARVVAVNFDEWRSPVEPGFRQLPSK
jgi:acylphosphatase